MLKKTRSNLTILFIALFLGFGATTLIAQSNDLDDPTAITSNVIEGEGDGKGEIVYFSFDAGKGDLKMTIDAKTDDRSTPLRVYLLDDTGREYLNSYVVALGKGVRRTETYRFVRSQKVIVKIVSQDDAQVNLLTYKIRFEGSAFTQPTPPMIESAAETPELSGSTTTEASAKPKTSEKVKKVIKAKAKELKEIVDF